MMWKRCVVLGSQLQAGEMTFDQSSHQHKPDSNKLFYTVGRTHSKIYVMSCSTVVVLHKNHPLKDKM